MIFLILTLHNVGYIFKLHYMYISCFYYFHLIWFGYLKLDLQNTDSGPNLALKASLIATSVLYNLFLLLLEWIYLIKQEQLKQTIFVHPTQYGSSLVSDG